MLEAIKNHDRKDYPGENESVLLTILSVADDLDAFGYTGIYRYSEIYLTRGIPLSVLGLLVKQNAFRRFDNLVNHFGFSEELIKKHEKRYLILDNFFNEYNKQAESYQFGGINPVGYCGIIEMFTCIVNRKTTLKDTCKKAAESPDDQIIRWFFRGLLSEINCSK